MSFSEKQRRARTQTVSEERRPLLLPQEVKELGSEEAIIFYEGLRPIRCQKIRYFNDRRFTSRLKPPPEAARPVADRAREEPRDNARETGEVTKDSSVTDSRPRESVIAAPPAMREATILDIDRIDQLTLEDFAIDFDRVKIPQKAEGERLTSEELKVATESFLASLRSR